MASNLNNKLFEQKTFNWTQYGGRILGVVWDKGEQNPNIFITEIFLKTTCLN